MQLLRRTARPKIRSRVGLGPIVEALDARVVLSGTASLHAAAALGTIGGEVTNANSGVGIRHVQVQLLNASGRAVQSTFTNSSGQYRFAVNQDGPDVVREVVPRGYVQSTPTFAMTAPAGSFGIDPATGKPYDNTSWYYGTNTAITNGPVGPFAWDTVAPAGDLPFESPINLHGPTVNLSDVMSVHFGDTVPKQIINNGHQVQVQFNSSPSDFVTVDGQSFRLAQFHYHAPSESAVNGHVYAMEEHFVTANAAGAETVVAVLLKLGAHNNALDSILNAASASLTAPNTSTKITTPIHFAGLLPTNTRGWYYEGSLTTPPLSQPVNWFVFATPITLDSAQLAQYELVASGSGFLPNARPSQPSDGRVLNEIDDDVDFQGTSVTDANFAITPKSNPRAPSA